MRKARLCSRTGFRILLLLLAEIIAGSVLARAAQIIVERNIQASKSNAGRAHFEVLVAADPDDGDRLLGCAIVEPEPRARARSQLHTIAYSSIDGGLTWQPTLEVDRGAFGSTDPSCTFGPAGRAYFAAIINQTAPESGDSYYTRRTAIYRSLDGGRTWERPVDLPWIEREYLSADNASSRFKGRVYLSGDAWIRLGDRRGTLSGFQYLRSADNGESFSFPYLLGPSPSHYVQGLTQGTILSDGSVVVAYLEVSLSNKTEESDQAARVGDTLNIVTSTDGGETFSAPIVAEQVHQCGTRTPYLAVDSSGGPFNDRLYLTWSDSRSGECEILFSFSSNKGRTWSVPIVVSDDFRSDSTVVPFETYHMMSVVAVNRTGIVGVMWYEPRDSPDPYGYSTRFSASLDGGETFLPSVRVSETPASYQRRQWQLSTIANRRDSDSKEDERFEGTLSVNVWAGHTTGMAADTNGVFHPFWIDNRTGVTQVWTARVIVKGEAFVHGSRQLSTWRNLTSKLQLQFTHPEFDSANNAATVEAYLLNTSTDYLSAPFKLRFISIRSEMGKVRLVGAVNDLQGAGAVVDVPAAISGVRLEPGAQTKPFRLRFSFTAPQPQLKAHLFTLVRFQAEVLGISK